MYELTIAAKTCNSFSCKRLDAENISKEKKTTMHNNVNEATVKRLLINATTYHIRIKQVFASYI